MVYFNNPVIVFFIILCFMSLCLRGFSSSLRKLNSVTDITTNGARQENSSDSRTITSKLLPLEEQIPFIRREPEMIDGEGAKNIVSKDGLSKFKQELETKSKQFYKANEQDLFHSDVTSSKDKSGVDLSSRNGSIIPDPIISNSTINPLCTICMCPVEKSYNPDKCQSSCPPCVTPDTKEKNVSLNFSADRDNDKISNGNDNFANTGKNIVSPTTDQVGIIDEKPNHKTDSKSANVNDVHADPTTIMNRDSESANVNDVLADPTTIINRDDTLGTILKDAIVMLTVPALLFLPFIIYRKAKHLYERRHYMRTNYLIDGMYSENNPLCFSDVIQMGDR